MKRPNAALNKGTLSYLHFRRRNDPGNSPARSERTQDFGTRARSQRSHGLDVID
jgi:hypothetical protein